MPDGRLSAFWNFLNVSFYIWKENKIDSDLQKMTDIGQMVHENLEVKKSSKTRDFIQKSFFIFL